MLVTLLTPSLPPQCSKSCVGGVQVREVQCLTQNKTFSNLCQSDLKPIKKRSCNTQPCTPELGKGRQPPVAWSATPFSTPLHPCLSPSVYLSSTVP